MNAAIKPADFAFFSSLAAAGSLSAAARHLGLTPAAVSKRLMRMEASAGVTLVNRTTRRMTLTPEGEIYLEYARNILHEVDRLEERLMGSQQRPTGLLRVNASPGFGRQYIAPIISQFVKAYPSVSVRLQLSVHPPALVDNAYDVGIQFGEPPDARIIAKRVHRNQRLICAAPSYLEKHGEPQLPGELPNHRCISIQQGYEAYSIWRLQHKTAVDQQWETVHVGGNLTTNDGETAVQWALDGHGVMMRAEWDINAHLRAGRLVHILRDYITPQADVYAVFSPHQQLSTRTRAFVDFLEAALSKNSFT